jgi:hypothetical protein
LRVIAEALESIFGTAFPQEHLGIPNKPIAAAEARLGFVLPEPLKDFYRVAGAARVLANADYRFLSPAELRTDGDHLIFCEEREGLAEEFGIALADLARLAERPNPGVKVRAKGDSRWFGEASALSAFLLGMAAWQVALLLPHKAHCPYPEKELKKLLPAFEPVGAIKMRLGAQLFGLVDRKRSIVAAYVHTSETLYVGSPRKGVLDELKQRLGFDAILKKQSDRSNNRHLDPFSDESASGSAASPCKTILEPLETIVKTAFPGARLGIASEQIAAAETRLGIVLPQPLKDFFAVAGGSRDLLNADYIFLPPEQLRMDGGHLIFCEQRQGLEEFGIAHADLASLSEQWNPPVNVRPKGRSDWLLGEEGKLSAFLLGMTAWQVALMLPEKARGALPQKELKRLQGFFEPVGAPDVRVGSSRFGLVDRKHSIVAAYYHTDEMLYVGTPHEDVLDELGEQAELDLDSL